MTVLANKNHFSVGLSIGKWRKHFSNFEYQVLICEALSESICKKKPYFEIAGYLLTKRRLFLTLKAKSFEIDVVLRHFYEILRHKIIHTLLYHTSPQTEILALEELHEMRLFEKFHITNTYLVQLLCGEKIKLLYYDLQLERLKKLLSTQKYCSLIDHSGALGPVVLHPKQCDHHHKLN